jgi:hypothetical protein
MLRAMLCHGSKSLSSFADKALFKASLMAVDLLWEYDIPRAESWQLVGGAGVVCWNWFGKTAGDAWVSNGAAGNSGSMMPSSSPYP